MLKNIYCDFDDGFVLLNPHFVKIFKSCQEALKSFDLSFKRMFLILK